MEEMKFKTEYLGKWCEPINIIVTSFQRVGLEKLTEIKHEKFMHDIREVKSCTERTINKMEFEDGETWIIIHPRKITDGFRFSKALVDVRSVTIFDLEIIKQKLAYYNSSDNLEYFNW